MLNEFDIHYRNLLKWASTPLPFPLVQMGRTFLFLWTFTIPFVLRGVVEERFSAMIFVFFLTYGFIGLEVVALKLLSAFGDGVNDLNVSGMREVSCSWVRPQVALRGYRSLTCCFVHRLPSLGLKTIYDCLTRLLRFATSDQSLAVKSRGPQRWTCTTVVVMLAEMICKDFRRQEFTRTFRFIRWATTCTRTPNRIGWVKQSSSSK